MILPTELLNLMDRAGHPNLLAWHVWYGWGVLWPGTVTRQTISEKTALAIALAILAKEATLEGVQAELRRALARY